MTSLHDFERAECIQAPGLALDCGIQEIARQLGNEYFNTQGSISCVIVTIRRQ